MSNEEGETKSEWIRIFISKKNCHEPRQTARGEIDHLFMTLDFSVIFILDRFDVKTFTRDVITTEE